MSAYRIATNSVSFEWSYGTSAFDLPYAILAYRIATSRLGFLIVVRDLSLQIRAYVVLCDLVFQNLYFKR